MSDRGADPQADDAWTLAELDDLLAAWIIGVWQQRLASASLGPEHVPAYLTDSSADPHLTAAPGIDRRLLRRGIAVTLVQHAGGHGLDDAAAFLHLPRAAANLAIRKVAAWTALNPEHSSLLATATGAVIETIAASARIDYRRRREAMSGWTLDSDRWLPIAAELRSRESQLQRAHTDWSDRKRATAAAIVWIYVIQGQHRFAPNRRGSGTIAGTPQDPGLALDRAWWRTRISGPTSHYTQLNGLLRKLADDVAATIDFAN